MILGKKITCFSHLLIHSFIHFFPIRALPPSKFTLSFWLSTFFRMTCKLSTFCVSFSCHESPERPAMLSAVTVHCICFSCRCNAKFLWKRIPDDIKAVSFSIFKLIFAIAVPIWIKFGTTVSGMLAWVVRAQHFDQDGCKCDQHCRVALATKKSVTVTNCDYSVEWNTVASPDGKCD